MKTKPTFILVAMFPVFLLNNSTLAEEISADPQDNKMSKLKEIVVESSNIKQEGENTVINITKSMRKGTVTTEQMLGNIPGEP